MIIRRLRLTDFRKYVELDIEFPEGLIGIVGNNGAGKTTLFEAIAFALYGAAASRTRSKGIRRDGEKSASVCCVELEFVYAGDSYRLIRELRGVNETQTAELYSSSGQLIAHRASGVEAFIHNRIGMDYQTFVRSIFARQKEVAVLTDVTPEERRRSIRRMMGIERIEKAIKKVREDKKLEARQQLAPELEAAEKAYRQFDNRAQKKKSTAQKARSDFSIQDQRQCEYNKLENPIVSAAATLNSLQSSHEEAKDALEDLKQSRSRLTKIQPELKAYERAERRKEQLDRAQGVFEEYQQLRPAIEVLERKIDQLTNDLAGKRQELSQYTSLNKKVQQTANAINKTEKFLSKLRRSLKDIKERLDGTKALLNQLDDNVRKVRAEGHDGRCPTCLRPIGGSLEEIQEHFREERVALEMERRKSQLEVDKLVKAEQHAEEALAHLRKEQGRLLGQQNKQAAIQTKWEGAKEQLAEKRVELAAKKTRLRKISKVHYDSKAHMQATRESDALKEVYDASIQFQQDVSRIHPARNKLKRLKEQIQRKQKEYKDLMAQKRKLAFRQAAYDKAKTAYDEAAEALNHAEHAASEARGEFRILQERIKQLDTEIKDKQARKKQIEVDQQIIQYLAQLEVIFKDFQSSLINRIRPLLANRSSLLFDQITEGRYTRIELDEDYQIFLVENGNRYPIRRFSGGEEDLANLCLRIAISQTLAELVTGAGWEAIALDEVFGSQDRVRRERLLQALQNLTGSFRQIFFITHIDDLQDRVQYVLHVAEDGRGAAVAQWAK